MSYTIVQKFERLPTNVRPKHYTLSLTPDLNNFTFEGEVIVSIEVSSDTFQIVLNASELNILSAVLIDGEKIIQSSAINVSTDFERITIVFKNKIKPGSYLLKITYNGILEDQMRGFYRCKYFTQPNNEIHYAAVTHFEPTSARRCFPCWDEPALKATFDISVTVPKNLVVVSNMPKKLSKEKGNLLLEYDFRRSPIMSTYLVAIVVGKYEYVEDKGVGDVLVRIYTPIGKKEQGNYALEVAIKILAYFTEYFNIAYPLPKLDLITVSEFSSGAMENWGLITYREDFLLADSKNMSAIQKQRIPLIVAHELAHQWFGNLVTMEWWTHLWLNEGFATFIEYLCVDHLFPEFEIWSQFVDEMYFQALELDGLHDSHPIEVAISHPSEITEIFDENSYSKGACVIRMLYHYVGDDDFRSGLHLYLTRHEYQNATTEDLWEALQKVSIKPIKKVMSSWTKQLGFPLITVSSTPGEKRGIELNFTQRKFNSDGSPPLDNNLWMIPVILRTGGSCQREISIVFSTDQTQLKLRCTRKSDWIKINHERIGFYRVQYEPHLLEKFSPLIESKILSAIDRLGLLNDLFAMVQAGHCDTVHVFKLIESFKNETNYTVWSSIISILLKLHLLLSYTDCFALFIKYQRRILSSVFKRLGFDSPPNETYLDTLLRVLILNRLAWLDDDKIIAEAKKRYEVHVKAIQVLSPDLRGACYKMVLRSGDEKVFNQLMDMYKVIDDEEEKNRIGTSFGAAKNPEILQKVLDFSTSEKVHAQDTVLLICSVAEPSREGRELAWKFLIQNWEEFKAKYENVLLGLLIKSITEGFASEAAAREVEAFFKDDQAMLGIERTVHRAAEMIRLNAAFLTRDIDDLRKYLQNKSK